MNALVFLSAQIRTGSTFMWQLFRTTEEFTTYFEPDLPDLFEFMKLLPVPLERLHHYHVDSYWDEYDNLGKLPELHSAMAKEIGKKVCLASRDNAPAFKQYLGYLIKSAEKRPMLQFNRCEFRLLWLRSKFPDSIIIHLWRNPRDQWASMFLGARPQYIVDEINKKIPYLSNVFQVLSSVKNLYQFHYLYHRLSNIAGQAHSTISICYDDLKQDPHQNVEKIFKLCNINKLTVEKAVSLLVMKQRKGTDIHQNNWYDQQEYYCDKIWEKEYGTLNPSDTINNQIKSANLINNRNLGGPL